LWFYTGDKKTICPSEVLQTLMHRSRMVKANEKPTTIVEAMRYVCSQPSLQCPPLTSTEQDFDMLDVDFEFFDPQVKVDFHGIKTLLAQLFDVDNTIFNLSALTDLILSQPLLGSTVKVDGNETDAYAFLSIINLAQHAQNAAIAPLIDYLRRKAVSTPALAPLANLLSQKPLPNIGLIVAEHLVNVPSEVVPPMYTMLLEEIEWAVAEHEPYNFSHYLIFSKAYTEVASKINAEDETERPKKKSKSKGTASTSGQADLFYFHPEDEVFARSALCTGSFDYTTPVDEGKSDSKRAFQEAGIRPQGHMVLIEASKFKGAVEEVQAYFKPNQ
jgi:protein BCP1